MEIFISQMLLNYLADMNACEQLINNNVIELFTFKNKNYIIIRTVSSTGVGVSSVSANECILLDYFEGQTYTLTVTDSNGYSNTYTGTYTNDVSDFQ